jgi:hypothetical protein
VNAVSSCSLAPLSRVRNAFLVRGLPRERETLRVAPPTSVPALVNKVPTSVQRVLGRAVPVRAVRGQPSFLPIAPLRR